MRPFNTVQRCSSASQYSRIYVVPLARGWFRTAPSVRKSHFKRQLCCSGSGTPEEHGHQQAQREILKIVHDASSLEEIREVLLPDGRLHPAVDSETSVDALCYIADNINEGLLNVKRGEMQLLDDIVRRMASSLDVELLRTTETAQLIWILETVERVDASGNGTDARRTWRLDIVKSISERQSKRPSSPSSLSSSAHAISSYSTRDLTNLACSIGNTQLFASSAPVVRFLILVLDELMSRIAKPHIRSAFTMRELGLLASAVATAHGVSPVQSYDARSAFEGFLTGLWQDGALPKLANRHSSVSGGGKNFDELKRFLLSYLRVFPEEPPDRMLEGVSSYLARRLKAELSAVLEKQEAVSGSKTLDITFADLAALLEFFAFYASRTRPWMPPITVVELVSVTGACMRLLTLVDDSPSVSAFVSESKSNASTIGKNNDADLTITAISSLLESHVHLNLRPAQETLLSLVPYVYHQMNNNQDCRSLESILESFSIFGFEPGLGLSLEKHNNVYLSRPGSGPVTSQ